ncbi:MAG: NAD(P)H-dependent oxidoreductase subunit E [Flavobacteriales bacterium]|nr:NAD(P)H-dependent oxidoreductase subunit E [Bacteroidota bacterium]MCB9241450.1 NAD(P)H-dependent oxidoreductase subunit E [Flavobacteriales bacterium]
MSKNLSKLSGRKGLENNLFDRLGKEAEATGTLDGQATRDVAREYLVGTANIYGTTTFYDFLKPENQGKEIYVCNGSTCMLAGTQDGVHHKISEHFDADQIGHMCCLGRCHENSSFHYKGKNYSGDAIEQLGEIIDNKSAKADTYHIGHHGEQILTKPNKGMDTVREAIAKALERGEEGSLEEIKTSSIRGRGGAGFPAGFKLQSCRNEQDEEKYIVCNADEGDPGAFSDRYLLEHQPWNVIAGMMIAGYVTRARWGVLYIRAEYPESIAICEKAVEDLEAAGLLGANILGSDFSYKLKVIRAKGAYICGEETSMLSSIEGQRAEVRVRPPYPTQQGLFSKPTVVNNVETLAAYPHIILNGGDWYKNIGTGRSSGTKLVSLDSFFNRPGLYEVTMGTPLSVVINDLGQGFREPVKAMHIGGPLGGLVPAAEAGRLTMSFESFSENGFLMGHASVVCIPETYPLVKYLEHLFEFTAAESCGKCFPCRLGSVRGMEMLQKAQTNEYKMDRELFDDLLETMEQGSLCALGGGLPLPVKNALEYFADELSPYFNNVPQS